MQDPQPSCLDLAQPSLAARRRLAIGLQYLCELDRDFDVPITGFAMPAIDVLFGEPLAAADGSENPIHTMARGGWGGIRTHEGREPLPVFKTGAFNRSATHPA